MNAHGRFFNVPRTRRRTSEGVVELPILYYDASNVMALFSVERAAATRLLAGTGLEPVMARGKALAGMSFFEYRDSSVGAYNEVATAVFAKPRGSRESFAASLVIPARWRSCGAYVVDLPVTTRAANAAGREIWGYPKFVTSISFSLRKRRVESSVLDPEGNTIVTVAGTMGRSIPAPPLDLVTYTLHEGVIVKTCVDVRGLTELHAPGDVQLRVGNSRHGMAENLNELGLDHAKPFALISNDRFRSRLHEGSLLTVTAHRSPSNRRSAHPA